MLVLRLFLVVCVAVTIACGRSGAGGTGPSADRWALSGLVADLSGAPLAGAKVEVLDGPNQGRSVTTDPSGRYTFASLEAGTFALRAMAAGLESLTRSVTLSSPGSLDFALRRLTGAGLVGRTVDAFTDAPLPGVTVRVEAAGEVTTDADGVFRLDANGTGQLHPVVIQSPATVERRTHVRVPGAETTLSLMPSSFPLPAFNEMFRNGGQLRRWVAPPRVVIEQRVLRFTSLNHDSFVATGALVSAAEVEAIHADLAWALPQLSGNRFETFADVRIEAAAEGATVPVVRSGVIVVARYEGLGPSCTCWGSTRWWWNGAGEVLQASVMLDQTFDSSASPHRRSLRSHELGHALGYNHVTLTTSVMNSNGRVEPTAFDRDGARFVFQRPTLNRAPDVDPDPYSTNRVRLAAEVFSRTMP